jgi:hypothetical protein
VWEQRAVRLITSENCGTNPAFYQKQIYLGVILLKVVRVHAVILVKLPFTTSLIVLSTKSKYITYSPL